MNNPKSKEKSSHKSAPQHDSEGRMGSPIAGNPAQRKNQVQSIAHDVFSDGMERDTTKTGDDMIDGNYQPESAHSSVTHHSHTTHDHQTGRSTTHQVSHGQDCPECGTEYMGHGR